MKAIINHSLLSDIGCKSLIHSITRIRANLKGKSNEVYTHHCVNESEIRLTTASLVKNITIKSRRGWEKEKCDCTSYLPHVTDFPPQNCAISSTKVAKLQPLRLEIFPIEIIACLSNFLKGI